MHQMKKAPVSRLIYCLWIAEEMEHAFLSSHRRRKKEPYIKLLHGYFLNPPKSARVSPVQKRFTSSKPASLSHFIWSSKGGRSRSKLMKQPPLLTRGNISA